MKKHNIIFKTAYVLAFLTANLVVQFTGAQTFSTNKSKAGFEVDQQFHFTENKGQVYDQFYNSRQDILYSFESAGLTFFLQKGGYICQQYKINSWVESESSLERSSDKLLRTPDSITIYRVEFDWVNTNEEIIIENELKVSGYENYYLPGCQNGITGVRSFGTVTYKNIYDGIDLRYYNKDQNFKYDFIIEPERSFSSIVCKINGAIGLKINDNGQLVIITPLGELIEDAPIAFQGNKKIKVNWKLLSHNQVTFDIPDYDPSETLVIDPVVRQWGTYYGGGGNDGISNVAIDDSLYAYVTGSAVSGNMATIGSYQYTNKGAVDAFIAKFDSIGNLQWATYYGDTSSETGASCIVDEFLNVYVSGIAYRVCSTCPLPTSQGVMATATGHQSVYGGGMSDAYLVKFDKNGTRLWATYYGGIGDETGLSCVVDNANNIYLTGYTEYDVSSALSTSGSHQISSGGNRDAFLVKFNSSGIRQWATYYGGADEDTPFDLAVDLSGNIYLAGWTKSLTNIATSGVHQNSIGGGDDAFLVKFNSNGIRQWGTYYGGISDDFATACVVDNSSNIYLTGRTNSSASIATSGSHQNLIGGGQDAFIVKITSNGTRQWGTYYGGASDDIAYDCAVDDLSNIYITGTTSSFNAISSSNSYQRVNGGGKDGFVAKLYDGIRLWGTYFGGTSDDESVACSVIAKDNLLIAGTTASSNAIASTGSYQFNHAGGGFDGFLVKFYHCDEDSSTISAFACERYESPSGRHVWANSDVYYDTLVNARGCDSILKIDLTIIKDTVSAIKEIACNKYTIPSGARTYQNSGVYFDTLTNIYGCDSTLKINLTIKPVNKDVSQKGALLTSHAFNVTYQWIDCNNGKQPINGQTYKQFTANKNGNYAVIISTDECSDTSDCFEVTNVGIPLLNQVSGSIIIYPNPAKKELNLESIDINLNDCDIQVINQQGILVFDQNMNFSEKLIRLDISHLNSGIYLIKIISKDIIKNEILILE